MELGYKNLGSYFPYDEVAAGNLDWFYHLPGGSLILIFSQFGRQIIQRLTKAKTSRTSGNWINVTQEDIDQLYE